MLNSEWIKALVGIALPTSLTITFNWVKKHYKSLGWREGRRSMEEIMKKIEELKKEIEERKFTSKEDVVSSLEDLQKKGNILINKAKKNLYGNSERNH